MNYVFPALHHPLLLSYLYSSWQIKLALSVPSCSPGGVEQQWQRRSCRDGGWYAVSLGPCLWKALCSAAPGGQALWGWVWGTLDGTFVSSFPFNPRRGGESAPLPHSAYPGAGAFVRGCPRFSGVDVEAWRGHSSTTVIQSGALEQGCLPATWGPRRRLHLAQGECPAEARESCPPRGLRSSRENQGALRPGLGERMSGRSLSFHQCIWFKEKRPPRRRWTPAGPLALKAQGLKAGCT